MKQLGPTYIFRLIFLQPLNLASAILIFASDFTGGGLRYAFVDGEIRILGFTEGSKSANNYCLTVCLAASHRFAYLLNLASIRTRLHPFFQSVLFLVKQVAHLCRRWSSFEPCCHLLHLTQLSRLNHPTHGNLQGRREELSRSVHLLIVLAKRRREEWIHSCFHRTLGSLIYTLYRTATSFEFHKILQVSDLPPTCLWFWAIIITAIYYCVTLSKSRTCVLDNLLSILESTKFVLTWWCMRKIKHDNHNGLGHYHWALNMQSTCSG
jgi:hypothetical protein